MLATRMLQVLLLLLCLLAAGAKQSATLLRAASKE
jgi:hypothetical protein